MPKLMPLICAAALLTAACASPCPPAPAPVVVPPPRLPDLPPEVMVERQPTFRERLLLIFSPSPTTPTK